MRKDKSRKEKNTLEKGSAMVEAALAFPLFFLLIGAFGLLTWVFWAQVSASIAAARSIRESGINRPGDVIYAQKGYSYFSAATSQLTGAKTAGTIGSPSVEEAEAFRMVRLFVTGSTPLRFGPLESAYQFGGGGSIRMHKFWPGPPSPWE